MAWFTPEELPENKYYIFGKEGCKELAEKENVALLGQIPIVQSIMEGGEKGIPNAADETSIVGKSFKELAENLIQQVDKRNKESDPTKRVKMEK